jgi:hypothetical protein
VEPVTGAELAREHPPVPVRCLDDLGGRRVWTASPAHGELAHDKEPGRGLVAVCGAALSEFATTADAVGVWGGGLCESGCWPAPAEETPAG